MQLNILGGQTFSVITIAQNGTAYTGSVPFQYCNGYAICKFTVSGGSVSISQQCSFDGQVWFDPVDNTNTALAVIASSAGTTTGRYVQYNPVLCNYMRYKMVEINIGATTVGIAYAFGEGV